MKWQRLFAASVILIGLAMLYCFNPIDYLWMPKCPFKIITGLQCPGCGGQRAIYALLHGHVKEALHYNYFLVYAGPYAFLFVVQRWILSGRAKTLLGNIIENKYVVWFYIVTFLVWMVVRNILGI